MNELMLTEYNNVTDKRIDRRTPHDGIVSRGKNVVTRHWPLENCFRIFISHVPASRSSWATWTSPQRAI